MCNILIQTPSYNKRQSVYIKIYQGIGVLNFDHEKSIRTSKLYLETKFDVAPQYFHQNLTMSWHLHLLIYTNKQLSFYINEKSFQIFNRSYFNG